MAQRSCRLVLLDASPAADILTLIEQPGHEKAYGENNYIPGRLRSALIAANGPLEAISPDHERRVVELPSDAPAAPREILPEFFTAHRAMPQVSLFSSLMSDRYDTAPRFMIFVVMQSRLNSSQACLEGDRGPASVPNSLNETRSYRGSVRSTAGPSRGVQPEVRWERYGF